jgi:hypothetical protein
MDPEVPRPSRFPRALLLAVLGVAALLLLGAGPATAKPGLRFGIYPNGGVGTVDGGLGDVAPDDATAMWSALDRLRGRPTTPFVLHLYTAFDGATPAETTWSWVDPDVQAGVARSYLAEVVLRYRPYAGMDEDAAVAAFEEYVRASVRHYAAMPRVVALQVTNEANILNAPDAADGAYPGASRALVRGVIAGRDEALRAGRGDLSIGFNVASGARPAFWRTLRRLGGRSFARAVGWVGVDLYPGTWSGSRSEGPTQTAAAMRRELRRLRRTMLPLAGVRRSARLVVAENGFPTGPLRSEQAQAAHIRAAIRGVAAERRRLGVTDYRWFDLRDAASAAPTFEGHYGVLRDDYTPKAGFAVLRDLVSRFGRR